MSTEKTLFVKAKTCKPFTPNMITFSPAVYGTVANTCPGSFTICRCVG